jgi:hypothetical protein
MYFSANAVNGRWLSDILLGDYQPWATLLLRSEPDADAAAFLKSSRFEHWLNLSPTSNQRAWFVADRPYWRETQNDQPGR